VTLSKRQFIGILGLTFSFIQNGCISHSISSKNNAILPSSSEIRLVKTGTKTNQFSFQVEFTKDTANQLLKFRNPDLDGWQKLFNVKAEVSDTLGWRTLPPVQGSYRFNENKLLFEPLFPLQYDINYHVILHTLEEEKLTGLGKIKGSQGVKKTFRINKPATEPSTIVKHVYPSANSLPENLLKFYVHFSAPMSQGNIYKHIHLYDSNDKRIELPFLELGEELWNPSETRITILFDPGRIKKGLSPRESESPILIQGESYKLIIKSDWLDASGTPLKESFTKTFSVTAPDNQIPSTNHWKVITPKVETKDPLILDFSEPLDHALISRLIWIEGTLKEFIGGTINTKDSEKRWVFVPEDHWTADDYKIVIETKIEDLAGNTVIRPFEIDRLEDPKEKSNEEFIRINFTVK
tara:strand:- start:483 stop:1709 length:1227 start_codon:yes stop_codon:yes gene_type:complete